MIGSGSNTGGRRRRGAVLAGAGIALVAWGGLATAAVAAANSPAQAVSLSVTQVRSVTSTANPTPYPSGWMMGGAGAWMMDDDDWGWHHGSVMTRTQARQAARTWVAAHHRGATTSKGTKVHDGYRFRIIRNGTLLGRVTVNTTTGHCAWARYR